MSFEKDAVRHSVEWRESFQTYLLCLMEVDAFRYYTSDGLMNIAEKFSDREFGIYQEEKAP